VANACLSDRGWGGGGRGLHAWDAVGWVFYLVSVKCMTVGWVRRISPSLPLPFLFVVFCLCVVGFNFNSFLFNVHQPVREYACMHEVGLCPACQSTRDRSGEDPYKGSLRGGTVTVPSCHQREGRKWGRTVRIGLVHAYRFVKYQYRALKKVHFPSFRWPPVDWAQAVSVQIKNADSQPIFLALILSVSFSSFSIVAAVGKKTSNLSAYTHTFMHQHMSMSKVRELSLSLDVVLARLLMKTCNDMFGREA